MSTSNDADRYADIKLGLKCPNCGSAGLVSLEQLDRMLFCFGCKRRYRVEPKGLVELPDDRVQVQVRTHLSEWEGHEAILTSRSALLGHWLLNHLISLASRGWVRWGVLPMALAFIGTAIYLGTRPPPEKPPIEIPDSLDGRVALFNQALIKRDMALLTRLTDPAQHRAMRIWLAHAKGLPEQVAAKQGETEAKTPAEPEVKIVGNIRSPTGDRSDLRVSLKSQAGEVVVDEQWAERGGVWYFQPVRLRSASVRQGPTVPYSKHKRGR